MRLIDADAIVFTHAIARSIDDGHNWNELCVTKDEIDDMPSVEPERKAKVKELERRSETSIGWEGICTNCGAYTIREMDFCFQCGAKLEWE